MFGYRLAMALGNPYPEQMLAGMSIETFRRWMEFDQVAPFGEQRADLRMAIETAHLLNALQGKGGRRMKPADIMPRFDRPARQSGAEMNAVMKQFADQFSAFESNNGRH